MFLKVILIINSDNPIANGKPSLKTRQNDILNFSTGDTMSFVDKKLQ